MYQFAQSVLDATCNINGSSSRERGLHLEAYCIAQALKRHSDPNHFTHTCTVAAMVHRCSLHTCRQFEFSQASRNRVYEHSPQKLLLSICNGRQSRANVLMRKSIPHLRTKPFSTSGWLFTAPTLSQSFDYCLPLGKYATSHHAVTILCFACSSSPQAPNRSNALHTHAHVHETNGPQPLSAQMHVLTFQDLGNASRSSHAYR